MANIARTANVASLNFWSAIVIAARIASTAYTPKANHNRFMQLRIPGAQGRIRTSVARKERQIYSLLPLTTRPPVHASTEHPALSKFLKAKTWARNRQSLLVKERYQPTTPAPESRQSSIQATRPYFRAHFCDSGSCCWNQFFSRRAARLVGLLLLRLSGALMVTILELAKGFEPPTL